MTCCAAAPSGGALAFGSGGGFAHLWGVSEAATACGGEAELQLPERQAALVELGEDDPWGLAPQYYSEDGR